jgi:hypothetical protein
VSKTKQLASLALAVVTLAGTSAFAESRPSNETRSRGEARSTVRRERSASRSTITVEGRRGDNSGNRSSRSEGRTYERRDRSGSSEGRTYERRDRSGSGEGRTYERRDRSGSNDGRTYDRRQTGRDSGETRYQSEQRSRNDGRYDRNRGGSYNGSRGGSYNGNRGSSHYGNRQPYHASGRVSRYQRYGGGYRVWIIGAPYPFYIPLAYWRGDRFRVGLSINLGGYYNPLGYYDYWDGYRDDVYNSGYRAVSEADFRGVVESVDYRRDSFVVRNDDTGDFITVVLRDRRETLPRSGDYVAVRGDWTTRGYFRAYDVDFLDNDRYDRDRY